MSGPGLEVGIALWTMQSTASAPASHAALYRDLRDDARRVEELGFTSLWLAEHRFWYDGWCPAPFVAAASAAAATERLRFGTAMLLLPQHDPLRLARTVATLDSLSGGRIDFGVGLGHRDAEFDGLGLRRPARGSRMDEALEVLTLAWSGRPFDFHGVHFNYSGAECLPSPAQHPYPPIWIGGMADEAMRRGARHGCSFLLPQTLYPGEVRELVERIGAEAAAAGQPRGRIGMLKDAWVGSPDDPGGDEFLVRLARHYREEAGSWWVLRNHFPGFAEPELLDRQLKRITETALVGPAGDLVRSIRTYADAGIDLLAVRLHFDITRGASERDATQRFARDVLPEVAGVPA